MWECSYCPHTSSRKWNMQVHEQRNHQDQILASNGKNQRNTNEYDPVQGEEIPLVYRHTKAKHGVIQTGSGILTREQPITPNVPIQYIEDAKGIIRQWQEAYQNMETRNKELLNGWQNQNNVTKQWEAAYRQMQAWREEDGEYLQEAQQQLAYLQNNARR